MDVFDVFKIVQIVPNRVTRKVSQMKDKALKEAIKIQIILK